ncbi:MAG: leucine-rich repeat domain-containing protein, partial [Clostridia bacterium]|nr:leucine-rich repeat domain-containing protein [Clostridia bacterium]
QFREGLLVNYTTKSFGVSFSLADEVVSFNKKNLKRKVAELKLLLPYLRNVKRVDMENCNIDNETMAALRDEFPQPKLVWRVKVGAYSVRTDAWMVKFSAGGSKALDDSSALNLKYCREIKYLDLGHNKIHHMDKFVSCMPDLEVCIMYNPMSNIKGIENCPKLEFFECYSCNLKDLSPLAACTELKHLNVCYNYITDITPLYGLTKLERLWIGRNDGIPKEQFDTFQELVPNCLVNLTRSNPTGDGWRKDENGAYVPRYLLLREQFRYDVTNLRSYGDGWWDDGKKVHFDEQPAFDPTA